jgi:hypothetical protein
MGERGDLNSDVRTLRCLVRIAKRREDSVLEQAATEVLRERLARLRALDAANGF